MGQNISIIIMLLVFAGISTAADSYPNCIQNSKNIKDLHVQKHVSQTSPETGTDNLVTYTHEIDLETINHNQDIYECGDLVITNLMFAHIFDTIQRVTCRSKSISHQYLDNVVIRINYYLDDELMYTYPFLVYDYTFNWQGMLPYSGSILMTATNALSYNRIELFVQYEIASPQEDDFFMCDQLLSWSENSFELAKTNANNDSWKWLGCIINSSNYPILSPAIRTDFFLNNQFVQTSRPFLFPECENSDNIKIRDVYQAPDSLIWIELSNCSDENQDYSGWSLGNSTNPKAYTFPENNYMYRKTIIWLSSADLNFQVLDENGAVYLYDNTGTLISTWDENSNNLLFQPEQHVCFDDYIVTKLGVDRFQFSLTYEPQPLEGTGNIPPNLPQMEKLFYETEVGDALSIEFFIIDYNNDDMELTIDWGDGTNFTTLSGVASRSFPQFIHTYADTGTFYISAKASDDSSETQWSFGVPVYVSGTPTAIDQENAANPVTFALQQNYPNPFNPSTTISYTVAEKSTVLLEIFDVNGRLVNTLTNTEHQPGSYQLDWNAATHSSGVYLCRMTAGSYTSVRKMLLIK